MTLTLYVWVEGSYDNRFFEGILKPRLSNKAQSVKIIKYASRSITYVTNFISSIKSMNDKYIFVHDFNSNKCITIAKEKLCKKYPGLEEDHIAIVKVEIESWYACGLKLEDCKKFGLPYEGSTESITKEKFDSSYKKKFKSKIDFTVEILKKYDMDKARKRNDSFLHFFEKYLSQ